jgi:hypothetical protein
VIVDIYMVIMLFCVDLVICIRFGFSLLYFYNFIILIWPFLYCLLSVPPKPRYRITIKGKKEIKLPEICMITGEPATEYHIISHTRFFLSGGSYKEYSLPFSHDGWMKYFERRPFSLIIYNGGFKFASKLGIFGFLVLIIWAFICCIILPFFAAADLLMHKRELIKIHGLSIKAGSNYNNESLIKKVVGIDITVPNKEFLSAFKQLNPEVDNMSGFITFIYRYISLW